MKLLNRGINPYVSVQASKLEENSIHPCFINNPCPINLCGPCSPPFIVAVCA
jgi:hypothetical protein